ncbi:Oligopeptide transport system permease protein OppB [Methanosarcina sp. MTP4]|uniref:ABC transporter permease n=1 Tax=Methanosarcina sp. MTP4 TaxID=1434100 RepID=UPI00061578CF|nr:ABC transporter permease [Methanosarcina sp. MTP4]AKB23520.1 Oligopeptide transport system permease protein OppB [Methanosarcina sp. MTP4]
MKAEYFARRFAFSFLAFLTSASISFTLLRLMPGDYIQHLMPYVADLNPELSALFRQQFGLDRSLSEQYFLYLVNVFQGNWGHSYQYCAPVFELIAEKLYWTLILLLPATFLSISIGILIGAYSGWKQGSSLDLSMLNFMIFIGAIPSYWWAITGILIFGFYLKMFPLGGFIGIHALENGIDFYDVMHHALLPICTLTLCSLPGNYYLMRNSMLLTAGEEYIRAARAKGVSEKNILFGHALKNAMLPMLTMITLECAGMLTGSIFIESMFSWPGLGLLTFEALEARDLPLLQGIFLMDALMVIFANFTADVLYSWVDPRIELG